MAVKPTVLLYNIEDKKRKNKIHTFCVMHGIRVRSVNKEDYGQTILAVLGQEEYKEIDMVDGFEEEMMLMCNIGSMMNPFLSHLSKEKIRIPLKAMMTATNQEWTSIQLYEEIREEHRQMTAQTTSDNS